MEDFAPQLPERVEVLLVHDTGTVALALIEVVAVLVGRVGEERQTHLSLARELDFDVQVAHDVAVVRRDVLPVADVAVDDHPVVEQLCGHSYVKDVAPGLAGLVVEAQVERDVELSEDVVELARHQFGCVREE